MIVAILATTIAVAITVVSQVQLIKYRKQVRDF